MLKSLVTASEDSSAVEGLSVIKSLATALVDGNVVDTASVLDLDVDCSSVGLSVVKDVVINSVEIFSVEETAVELVSAFSIVERTCVAVGAVVESLISVLVEGSVVVLSVPNWNVEGPSVV